MSDALILICIKFLYLNDLKVKVLNFLGHYDPYDAVMTSSNYSYFCNPQNPFACEVGDLSGKQVCR